MINAIRYVDEVIAYTGVDKMEEEDDSVVYVTAPVQCHYVGTLVRSQLR